MSDSKEGIGAIAVIGASGHTGRFVVAELERRGIPAIRIGRSAARLAETSGVSEAPTRTIRIDDGASLDAALSGARAVINCAGPFLDTAPPVIDAALRARIPYLDVCAEQATVQNVFAARDAAALEAGVQVLPAAAFFGGLADLLATVAADGAEEIDEIAVAVGLDSWYPTQGTRLTGQRNTAPRLVQRGGRLEPMPPAQSGRWDFPHPLGARDVIMLPFSETITLASHLRAGAIDSWINVEPIRDIRDPQTPEPVPASESGRSAQRFVLDVIVTIEGRRCRATAIGQDIYHVSAPIIVEAVERLIDGRARNLAGVQALGSIFEPRDFLHALESHGVQTQIIANPPAPLKREMTDAPAD